MATLKANGGAVRMYRHPVNGTRLAVCENGRVPVNPGGANGWKRSRLHKGEIADRGYVEMPKGEGTRARYAAQQYPGTIQGAAYAGIPTRRQSTTACGSSLAEQNG
jgi:hypothetical protein